MQVHVVHFDAQQKISQIRLYWDQGSLLKQVEVIGARGRSWPIRDSSDQLKLIQKGVAAEPKAQTAPSSPPQKPRDNGVSETAEAQPFSPSKKPIRDPHASLSLFSDEPPTAQQEIAPNLPKSAAKPPPRDYSELFVGDDADGTPSKAAVDRPIPPKGGAGQNYKPSRLFGDPEDEASEKVEQIDRPISSKGPSGYSYQQSRIIGRDIDELSTESSQPDTDQVVRPKAGAGHSYKPSRLWDEDDDTRAHPVSKTNTKKYSHFEFGDGEDEDELEKKDEPVRPRSSRHDPQWKFEDFATPEKPRNKVRAHETRHFGWSDDEPDLSETPQQKPRTRQPRRDAETHFEFQDEPTPVAQKVTNGRSKGSVHNDGLSLYQNNLYDDDGLPGAATADKASQGVMPNGASRMKTFGAHFEMSDTSPAAGDKGDENKPPAGLDRQKAAKMMDSSWAAYDESPEPKTATALPNRSSRHVNERSWGFGDDGDF